MEKQRYDFKLTKDAEDMEDNDFHSKVRHKGSHGKITMDIWGWNTTATEVARVTDRVMEELNNPEQDEFTNIDALGSIFLIVLLFLGVWQAGELFAMLIL